MGGYKKDHTYGGAITLAMAKTAIALRSTGNSRQAGEQLGISREAVVSLIRHLETTLKRRLFSRRKGFGTDWQALCANRDIWARIETIADHHELKPIEVRATP